MAWPQWKLQVADPQLSIPVTGGYDPDIRLWNPFMAKKPVWLMKGHRTAVTHIMVGSKNSSILISISKDKVPDLCSAPYCPVLGVQGEMLQLSQPGG